MYLEFSDYVSYGGNLEKAAFDRFSYRAERLIETHTFQSLREQSIRIFPRK